VAKLNFKPLKAVLDERQVLPDKILAFYSSVGFEFKYRVQTISYTDKASSSRRMTRKSGNFHPPGQL